MNSPSFSPLYVLMILVLCVLAAELLAGTKLFRRFGAAIIVIVLTALVANAGIIPTNGHVIYDSIFNYVAPASIFLLLLDVNLRSLKKVGIPMLALFLIGALGTTTGVLIATLVIPDSSAFEKLYAPLAGMLAGTYTGGSLNFNAVALHFNVMEKGVIFAGAIAVDNIITTLWMFFTLMIPTVFGKGKLAGHATTDSQVIRETPSVTIKGLSVLIALTICSLWISDWLAERFSDAGFPVPSILIITTLALIFAQFPVITKLPLKNKAGTWLVFLFLGVVGAYCDISALGEAGQLALLLLGFVLIIITVHFILLAISARIFRWDWDLVAIASQANIGGSTTAMALAQSFGRHELVLPAIAIGSLGNAIGTYIGFAVAGIV